MTPEEKINKIDQAISLGLLKRRTDFDGIIRYILTPKGELQWTWEVNNK